VAIRTVSVKVRIRTSDGKRVVVDPVWETKGRLRPLWARVCGKAEHHPEAVYALRYGTKWEYLGQDIGRVTARKLALEQELEDSARSAPAKPNLTAINQSGPAILDALEILLAEMSTTNFETGKEALYPKTIDAMRRTLEAFQRTCKKTYIREITGDDIVGYLRMMRIQANLNPAAPDYSERLRMRNVTVGNHYARLRQFFKRFKVNIADMLEPDQIPKTKGRVPTSYSEAELLKMWAVCKPEEKIRLQFFCASGLRRGEVAHTYWSDIDLDTGVCTVQAMGEWNWKPKNKEPRSVRRPDWLVTLLAERRQRHPEAVLVFPTSRNMPPRKNQLLKMLQDVAKRAGLGGRVDLHNFRATYASMLNRSGSTTVEEIAGRLGHVSVSTTRAYLARMNQNTDRAAQQSNDTFAKLA
jgi:integrase